MENAVVVALLQDGVAQDLGLTYAEPARGEDRLV